MAELLIVLGDQLDMRAAALQRLDPARDAVVMVEAREEAAYLRQGKKRLVLFFAAMRHFRDALRAAGWTVHYIPIDGAEPAATLADGIARVAADRRHVTQPGDWRVLQALRARFPGLEVHPDRHFLVDPADFAGWRGGRRRLVLEDFYRWQRQPDGLADGRRRAGRRRLEPRPPEPQELWPRGARLHARTARDRARRDHARGDAHRRAAVPRRARQRPRASPSP